MSDTKKVVLWESTVNLQLLAQDNFNFQFAKSVVGRDGELTFNIVWQSQTLQPITEITWQEQYAFNWSQSIPAGGATITMGGFWQPCALGQVFDITPYGTFEASAVSSTPGYMKIGKNKKSVPGTNGIHIVVGLKNASGTYDPIYVDNTAMGMNMSGTYQPQDRCQWWYQEGARTSTMISNVVTPVDGYDMSVANPLTGFFYVSTTYDYKAGSWLDSPYPPPSPRTILAVNSSSVDSRSLTSHGGADSNRNLNMQTLQRKMNSLEDVLSTIVQNKNNEFDNEDALPNINFRGIVNWPVATTLIAMTAGATLIATLLIARGYSVEKTIDEETKKTTFRFGRDRQDDIAGGVNAMDGNVPASVERDWNDAFNDSKVGIKDGAKNGGVYPGNSNFSRGLVTSARKIRARDVFNEHMNGYAQHN